VSAVRGGTPSPWSRTDHSAMYEPDRSVTYIASGEGVVSVTRHQSSLCSRSSVRFGGRSNGAEDEVSCERRKRIRDRR